MEYIRIFLNCTLIVLFVLSNTNTLYAQDSLAHNTSSPPFRDYSLAQLDSIYKIKNSNKMYMSMQAIKKIEY